MSLNNFAYGQNTEEVNYWINNRSKLADLYKSESYFFEQVIGSVNSVLDIGCAAGGSAVFSREKGNNLKYTGIDVSQNLIDVAKKRFHSVEKTDFLYYDGTTIPLENNSVDFVFSFGVFHHLNNWKDLVHEALRVSSKYFLFDIRTWQENTLININASFQKLALAGEWDQKSIIPYNLVSFNDLLDFATELKQQGCSVELYGYWGNPTSLAVTPAKKVLMTSILIEKNSKQAEIKLRIE